MTEKKPVPGLRSLLEDTLGLEVDDAMRQRIRAVLDGPLAEDEVDDLMEDWINVENADGPRAAWIRGQPEAFRA